MSASSRNCSGLSASLLRLPRKAAAALIIPCLFFYSAITGFHVSSVRAATMAAFLLGGIFFDRPVLALNSLAGAALLIWPSIPTNFSLPASNFPSPWSAQFSLGQNRIFRKLLRPSANRIPFSRAAWSAARRIFERTDLRLVGGRHFSFGRGLGRFVSLDYLVFLPHHPDLVVRESDRCPGRLLRAWPSA